MPTAQYPFFEGDMRPGHGIKRHDVTQTSVWGCMQRASAWRDITFGRPGRWVTEELSLKGQVTNDR